ncbi:MAG: hypothetical protein QM715_18265 [Nibricoccus sp.]
MVAATAFVGCVNIADVTKNEPEVCELHKQKMEIREVRCIPGSSVYSSEYSSALISKFPHHGGPRFAEDLAYLNARKARIHVCPNCDEAYRAWQLAHSTHK